MAAGKTQIDLAYDIPRLGEQLDFISLMTYDIHGDWESRTGHNSPLYAGSTDDDQTKNLDWTVTYWLDKVCSVSVVFSMFFFSS